MKWPMLVGIAALGPLACEPAHEDPKGASTGAPSADASANAASSIQPVGTPVREGNVVARAPADDALFIADEDHALVRALALPVEIHSKPVDTKVPGRPAQVVLTLDRVLVTIRQVDGGGGALLVLRRKPGLALEEIGRVALPADAWGVSLTPDEKTALVSSAWTHRLSAVDLDTLKVKWSVDVAREPRGITILPTGDRAYVSHLVGSDVTRVDGVSAKEPSIKRIELPASPLRSPAGVKLPASLGYSVVASPDGDRVFFPRHALGALGANAWFGVGAVDVLRTTNDTPLAPARAAVATTRFADTVLPLLKTQPWMDGAGPVTERSARLSSPRAVAYRKTTSTILVANEADNSVTELDALAIDPALSPTRIYGTSEHHDDLPHPPQRGAAPSGIALSAKEDVAYVFCRVTDDLVVIKLPPDQEQYRLAPPISIPLGVDDKKQLIGKALFYTADNYTMSGGLACAGCHPEGRDDGHVWHEVTFTLKSINSGEDGRFTNFLAGADVSALKARWGDITPVGDGGVGYARQTPMLAGRVKAAGPYGWHGESPDLSARIVAGFGLHRWLAEPDTGPIDSGLAGYVVTFLREGLVPPPRDERPLTDEEARGKALFTSQETRCAGCHVVESEYTDRGVVSLQTLKPTSGFAQDPSAAFKTPSLLYVGGTPPYLHDGRFESLESLIAGNDDRMGKTTQLSAEDKKALVAYLRTL